MEIVSVPDEGLGNTSYLVAVEGLALAIDPFRDPLPYLALAARKGWRITHAAETHLHADFVSGARELEAATGARIVVPSGVESAAGVHLLDDGEEIELGGLTVQALFTPGHTPEHHSYLLRDGAHPLAVFTGGTLITGGAARPDLLGPEHTEWLARSAWRSIRQRLLSLPDETPIYPTHGAGSFCSAAPGGERYSTIGAERRGNFLLQAPDEDTFVERLLESLGSYPPYFLELRDVNRSGPPTYGPHPEPLPWIDLQVLDQLIDQGAELVDVRPIEAFAAGHIPGSISIELRDQFATWLGWLVRRDKNVVFLTDDQTDRRQLLWACLGIGFERLAGELGGGFGTWVAAGRNIDRIPLVEPGEAGSHRQALDIRQRNEWEAGHVPGAIHLELGRISEDVPGLDRQPLLVHCGHGERAMTAASLLARQGHADLEVLSGGPEDLASARGRRLDVSA